MIFYGLHKSDKPDKKYYVELGSDSNRKKRVYFGDSNMKDYTLFNALEREGRKRAYLSRHKSREDWNDPNTAGFWSRHILWGDTPSVQQNLKRTLSKYNLTREHT
jgi:hypothetical protein